MGLEMPLGPREQKPDRGLLANLEKAGAADNVVGNWLREFSDADRKIIDARVFNLGVASPADLKFVESPTDLEKIRLDMDTLLTIETAHRADEAGALGRKIAQRIEAASQ